jgi:hypothetical protein
MIHNDLWWNPAVEALAEMTVATGENWIGNMSNKKLREIFSRD